MEYKFLKGKKGFKIYQYRLVRRPGQGPLLSQRVRFGGMTAPRSLTPLTRPGIVDVDISGGREAAPIPAVNEALGDDELPPCTALDRIPAEADLCGVLRGITPHAL